MWINLVDWWISIGNLCDSCLHLWVSTCAVWVEWPVAGQQQQHWFCITMITVKRKHQRFHAQDNDVFDRLYFWSCFLFLMSVGLLDQHQSSYLHLSFLKRKCQDRITYQSWSCSGKNPKGGTKAQFKPGSGCWCSVSRLLVQHLQAGVRIKTVELQKMWQMWQLLMLPYLNPFSSCLKLLGQFLVLIS